MKLYRVFVQDRPGGLYSGFCDLRSAHAREAERQAKAKYGWRGLPALHAILWPPRPEEKRWLDLYVFR
jgi:hypothetical protein